MCWNAQASWTALILGTALNLWLIYKIQNPTIYGLAIIWQWIILMQFYEAMYWSNQSKSASMLADLTSILQPVVLIIVLLIVNTTSNIWAKVIAGLLCISYIFYILYRMAPQGIETNLEPKPGCTHLNISWPLQLQGSAFAYLLVLFLGAFLLIRPINFALIIVGYIFVALLLSGQFYSCGLPSMWCFFSVLAPLVTYLAWTWTHPIKV